MANSTSNLATRSSRRALTIAAVVLGVVFLIIAAVYVVMPASSLPVFFPGHDVTLTTHTHYKHAIAAGLLAAAAFVFAWFNSGPASANQEQHG